MSKNSQRFSGGRRPFDSNLRQAVDEHLDTLLSPEIFDMVFARALVDTSIPLEMEVSQEKYEQLLVLDSNRWL